MSKKHNKKNNKKNPFKKSFWKFNRKQISNEVVDLSEVKAEMEKSLATNLLPSTKALIYASELDFIAKCIQDYPDIETGGQLFGSWTASGAPRVIYVLGPGPRANHQTAFFNQDVAYLKTIGAILKEYGLQHIGEWHSHHHLGLPHPSGHDAQTMQNGIAHLNLDRLLLCIGSFNNRGIVIKPFNFARDAHYIPSQWEVINTRNRLREVIDTNLEGILCNPSSTRYTFSEDYIVSQKKPVSHQSGWFSLIENRQAFKQIIDWLKAQNGIIEATPQISSYGIVTLKLITQTFAEIITFPVDFPTSPFEIDRMGLIDGTCTHYSFEQEWISAPNIPQIFKENYKLHLMKHL